MKKRFTILLLFVGACLWGQTPPCLPSAGGEPAGDVPPGCRLCGPVYAGSTAGFTADSFQLDFPCGTIENSQFISIEAPLSGTIECTIIANDCRDSAGIEMALYDSNLNLISNCFSSGGTNLPGNIVAAGLIPRTNYYLMIDGYDGDECEILLTVTGGIVIGPPPVPSEIMADPDVDPCVGAYICYSINSVNGASEYEWIVPINAIIFEGGGINDLFVCVQYVSPGGGVVRVTPSNDCFVGFPVIHPVSVPTIPISRITEKYCQEDGSPGNDTTIIYTNSLGCDSTVQIRYQAYAVNKIINLKICDGQCYTVGDSCYFESTRVRLISPIPEVCDSILFLNMEEVDTIPAPETYCFLRTSSILFTWRQNSINDGYLIEIQGVVVDTLVNLTSYQYQLSPNDSLITFRVIPFGNASCPYGIGEVTCDLRTNSTTTPFHESGLKIHPNPTNGQVQIESKSPIENVTVFDISGRKVMTSQQANVSLEAQPPGMYFFKVEMKEGVVVRRIIKN